MEPTQINIEAAIAADTSKVWQLYTEPGHITHWNFASPDWHCPHAENDLRVGGTYRARMEARDGSFGFDFEGVYQEVVPRQKIVYTLGDGRQVTTLFAGHDDGTVVTTIFDAERMHDVDMQRNGWQAILNNFKEYVEAS